MCCQYCKKTAGHTNHKDLLPEAAVCMDLSVCQAPGAHCRPSLVCMLSCVISFEELSCVGVMLLGTHRLLGAYVLLCTLQLELTTSVNQVASSEVTFGRRLHPSFWKSTAVKSASSGLCTCKAAACLSKVANLAWLFAVYLFNTVQPLITVSAGGPSCEWIDRSCCSGYRTSACRL